ncbi:CRAL/TRIO domain containing protein [Nitzschia inconspicua]|uniref:CRAL/TRIO domain containing protein n=1 Tax=Nitzschia inconspicua TaxID=303405 RepID=A0A9K3KEZ5_9STRA|nr:CRAL/TRIO domain containing protein [Nitzschia inconspicua]
MAASKASVFKTLDPPPLPSSCTSKSGGKMLEGEKFAEDNGDPTEKQCIGSPRPWNSRQSLTSGVATCLDGMSRAVILPFGPSLVHRLLLLSNDTNDTTTTTLMKLTLTDSSRVPLPYAMVVAAYVAGRALGWRCFQNFNVPPERLPRIVARLSGMIIALYVFTLGSGLQSVAWLAFIRFVAGTLVGILCAITREKRVDGKESVDNLPQVRINRSLSDDFRNQEEGLVDHLKSRNDRTTNPRIPVWTAGKLSSLSFIKLYLSASAGSILLGGLVYRHATGDVTFQALTQTDSWSLSTAFLVAVAVVAEATMRFFFSYTIKEGNARTSPSKMLRSKISGSYGDSFVDWSPNSPTLANDSPTTSTKRPQSVNSDVFVAARERLESSSSFRSSSNRRSRLETTDSDYFFDCQSVLSDMEDLALLADDEEIGEPHGVAQYRDRKVIYSNGSPAHVPSGDSPDVIPENYLSICNGNVKKAETMWNATQEWRRRQSVWRIHRMPNKWFTEIKKAYPHFVHGFSKEGYPIIYEQPGKMNLKQLFRSGCNVGDMVRHYVFFLEYISNHVCTRQEIRSRKGIRPPRHNSSTWGMMVVMDVKGAGLSHLSGDVLSYLKSAGEVNNSHYPLSLKRAFAINSPFWLAGAWSSIKGIMPESVHVDLLSSHQFLRALRERIDDDQIPPEYGGSSPYKLGEHPFEKELQQLVEQAESTPEECDPEEFEKMTSQTQDSSFTTTKATSNNNLRHRATSQDERDIRPSVVSFNLSAVDHDDKKTAAMGGEGKNFLLVSTMLSMWMIIQGVTETAAPLWLLLPPDLGGLGYAPSRSGMVLFSSSIFLIWAVGVCLKARLVNGPIQEPMRSYRIALGITILLLFALAIGPKHTSGEDRTNSVTVMAMTIISLSFLALGRILGCASSTLLHSIASTHLAGNGDQVAAQWMNPFCAFSSILDYECCYTTYFISFFSELVGVAMGAFILFWSVGEQRSWPWDGTLCFTFSGGLSVLLYLFSFSIQLNRSKDGGVSFQSKERFCAYNGRSRRCLSFIYELVSVSLSDMASLFDESNWSTSPLLGRQGSNISQ